VIPGGKEKTGGENCERRKRKSPGDERGESEE